MIFLNLPCYKIHANFFKNVSLYILLFFLLLLTQTSSHAAEETLKAKPSANSNQCSELLTENTNDDSLGPFTNLTNNTHSRTDVMHRQEVIDELVQLILSGLNVSADKSSTTTHSQNGHMSLNKRSLISELITQKQHELFNSIGELETELIMQEVRYQIKYFITNSIKYKDKHRSKSGSQQASDAPISTTERSHATKISARVLAPVFQKVFRTPKNQEDEDAESSVFAVAISPNGKYIVSGSDDTTIHIWKLSSGLPVRGLLNGHTEWVSSVAFSPNGDYMITGSDDQTVRIWKFSTRKPIGEPLRGHMRWVNAVAFSPNGEYIVSGSEDGSVRIWEFPSGKPVGEPLRGHIGAVNSVAISPNGKYIISGSDDTTIRIWNLYSGLPVGEHFSDHTDWVNVVAFSPDGQYVVSGSDDNTVRIWKFPSGKPVGEPLKRHTDWVNAIAITPDGKYIFSGSDDKTVRIWEFSTRKPVGEPIQFKSEVKSIALSQDGLHVVIGLNNGEIHHYYLYQDLEHDESHCTLRF